MPYPLYKQYLIIHTHGHQHTHSHGGHHLSYSHEWRQDPTLCDPKIHCPGRRQLQSKVREHTLTPLPTLPLLLPPPTHACTLLSHPPTRPVPASFFPIHTRLSPLLSPRLTYTHRYLRATTYYVPLNRDLHNDTKLPLAVICRPCARPEEKEVSIHTHASTHICMQYVIYPKTSKYLWL